MAQIVETWWGKVTIVNEQEARDLVISEFDAAVARFTEQMQEAGAYMPALATRLRIHADDLADKFPDDANQTI